MTADQQAIASLTRTVTDLETELEEIHTKLDQLLTDPNYEGGLQWWITKHDALAFSSARLANHILLLGTKWEKEAKQYQVLIAEARKAGTPRDQLLSMMTTYRACAKELLALPPL